MNSPTSPASAGPTLVRPSRDDDLPAMAAIYAHHVRHGTGSFELEPPTEAVMAQRRQEVQSRGLPWLVIEQAGQVMGQAYANWLRPRPAYRFALEDSIYIAPQATGRGLGRILLAELIARCEELGARQMVAVIGDSHNHGSIRLHAALGFQPAGVLPDTGWKFNRWLDTVYMQRALGPGADQPAPTDSPHS